jgi:DNA-binding LytR/AlgR family response regulator
VSEGGGKISSLTVNARDVYCEVQLIGGLNLLVTIGLARLHSRLRAAFIRIHKSYVVNCRHVSGIEPRPGGGRQVRLQSGAHVPLGRSFEKALMAPGACLAASDR